MNSYNDTKQYTSYQIRYIPQLNIPACPHGAQIGPILPYGTPIEHIWVPSMFIGILEGK